MSESAEPERGENSKDNEVDEKIGAENKQDGDEKDKSEKDDKKKKKKCAKKNKWTCEDEPLWRVYMNSYLDREEKLEREDKFDRRKAAVLPRFPNVQSSEEISSPSFYPCFPFNTFNLGERARLPNKLNPQEKVRLWKRMKNDPAIATNGLLTDVLPDITRTDSEKWPETWPCTDRDLAEENRRSENLKKRKKRGLLPCQKDTDGESNPDEPIDNFADHKELGHARIPITCRSTRKRHRVDRDAGEHPGLVDGDYVVFLVGSGNDDEGNRAYANVCLRGLKGMHLVELSDIRVREKTWKFCFYQAVVALLAKTQLRYKFAWSANIDYIYDHAWMLFVHMGSVNVKDRIYLDDVVVYNYKYSVELELVHETNEALRLARVDENYVEDDLIKMLELSRPELMKIKEQIGWEKTKFRKSPPVHETTRKIEKWFDSLPEIYRNCIIRTSKFSLAFWKDGTFWYLFNPYRCDEFGFWSDEGYACMLKFCSRNSLKRHLMILLLRAYSYEPRSPLKLSPRKASRDDDSRKSSEISFDEDNEDGSENSEKTESTIANDDDFTIQIFQMIYHCARIQNVKLLQRKPPDPPSRRVKKKIIDDCDSDLLEPYDPCSPDRFPEHPTGANDDDDDDDKDTTEKPHWLKHLKVTWARLAAPKKKNVEDEPQFGKLRWHEYYVEEPRKIFTLWGQIHPTEQIFAKENRGRQIYACYVVCAGMTRIQAPEYWSPKTLDAIVMCGDRFYTMSKLESEIASGKPEVDRSDRCDEYLSKNFKIGETMFEANVLPAVCGQLYNRGSKCLWKIVERMIVEHHFGIVTCESSCLGIFKFCGAYYMMDVRSFGPPLFQYGNGVAYLIRTTSFWKFMTVLVLTIGSTECSRFSVNPIEIGKVVDLGTTNSREKKGIPRFGRSECPHGDAAKGSRKSKGSGEGREAVDRVSCRKPGCEN